jgi:hypothetical protein
MRFKTLRACVALVSIALLAACHSKIDLTDINQQAEVELGLAFPVGSIHATLGDFLGNGQVSNICLDESGVFHFIDTVGIPTKSFHDVDVKKYVLENEKPIKFGIKEAIGKSVIKGDGETVTELEFNLTLGTENFNKNVADERIDSLQISEANFVSIINVADFGLNWSELRKVELVLGSQFRRPEGKTIDIPVKGYGYKQEIPISVKKFSLDMMDPNGGTVEKIKFKIRFYVCPDKGHDITVTDDSQFSYDLRVKVVTYDAIWGFFQAGNDLRDAQILDMDSLWDGWKDIKKLKVRFMEPTIEAFITHHVAAPLHMYINYIAAIDSAGRETRATWNDNDFWDFQIIPSLNPYSGNLNDSITVSKKFTYDPALGHVDKLFEVRPDFFKYSYHTLVDAPSIPRPDYTWPQHRITSNVGVYGYAVADVPFKINTGSELEYRTTLEDIDISSFSLDSLKASIQALDSLKASNIKLIMEVENGLPFKVEGTFTFLNHDSVDMHMELFQDNKDNHLLFPAPEMVQPAGQKYGYVDKPSVTRVIISLDNDDFNRMAEVGYIRMDVAMVDNPMPCMITDKTDLRVRIGLSAYVDAILDFGKDKGNNSNTNNQ